MPPQSTFRDVVPPGVASIATRDGPPNATQGRTTTPKGQPPKGPRNAPDAAL